MKININRRFIEGIIDSANPDFVDAMDEKIQNLLSLAIEDLSNLTPYVSLKNTIIQPVNEIFSGGYSSSAQFCYFLGVENMQIEINSIEKRHFWKNLKRKLVNAWYSSKKNKKKRRKKKQEEEDQTPHIKEKKVESSYKISHLKLDLQDALLNYLQETSIVYYTNRGLKIIGKDDFGTEVEIYIYVVMYDSDKQIYKYYNQRKNKFIEIDFKERFRNLYNKHESAGDNFIKMIKIFNSIYKMGLDENANQIMIESLLYNIPDELYKGDDIYICFIKIVNYLKLSNTSTFASIANGEVNIFQDILFKEVSSALSYQRFIKLFENIEVENI